MGRYATRENELDAMLRAGRFVDLYAVVRQGLRAGIERYSIKNLKPLYAFTRAVPLADAGRGLRALEYALPSLPRFSETVPSLRITESLRAREKYSNVGCDAQWGSWARSAASR